MRFHPAPALWISCFICKRTVSVRVDGVLSQGLRVEILVFLMVVHFFPPSFCCLMITFQHRPLTLFTVLPILPLSIAFFRTVLLAKPLPTSSTVTLFAVYHLLPIWDKSVLGALQIVSISTLPEPLSSLFQSGVLFFPTEL